MTNLSNREKELIKYHKQYLNLVNQITRFQLSGINPPDEMLKQTQEISKAAEIPEPFLKSILS